MLALDITPATVVVGLVVVALAFLAARRLRHNGTCDCHKGASSTGESAGCACGGGCAGCSGCATINLPSTPDARSYAIPNSVMEEL